ncbi:MAG: OmpA family protein [Bacteroidota bacterium]
MTVKITLSIVPKAKLICKLLLIAVFTAIGLSPVFAQKAPQGSVEHTMEEADKRFKSGDFQQAAKLYVEVVQADNEHALAMFKAGISYLYNSMPRKGLSFIQKSREIDPEVNPYYFYWLGRAFHLNYKVDSALLNYRRYLSLTTKKNGAYRRDAEMYREQAHRGRSFFITIENAPFRVENMGDNINSPWTESNPVFTKDGNTLFFTTRRPYYPHEEILTDGEYYEKVYYSYKKIDGTFTQAVPLDINPDKKSHLFCIQLIDNDTKLLLNRPGIGGGELLVSTYNGETWSKPEKYNSGLNTSDFDFSAHYAPDMNTLVFSTFPNKSHLDIMQVTRKKNSGWGAPVKLSEVINTEEDETSPYITNEGKSLLFSSKGHNSIGGFDIFRSDIGPDGKWSEVKNAGYPINTPGDEKDYTEITENGNIIGFMSAERTNSMGKADLYKILPGTYTEITGLVTDEKGKGMPDINVIIRDKYNVIFDAVLTDTTGRYRSRNVLIGQNYNLVVMKENITLQTTGLEIPLDAGVKPLERNFTIQSAVAGLKMNDEPYKFSLDTLPERDVPVISRKAVPVDTTYQPLPGNALQHKNTDSTIAAIAAGSEAKGIKPGTSPAIALSDEKKAEIQKSINNSAIAHTEEERQEWAKAEREKAALAAAEEKAKAEKLAADKAESERELQLLAAKLAADKKEKAEAEKAAANEALHIKEAEAKAKAEAVELAAAKKEEVLKPLKKAKKSNSMNDYVPVIPDKPALPDSLIGDAPAEKVHSGKDSRMVWIHKPTISFEKRKPIGSFYIYFAKNKFMLDRQSQARLKFVSKTGHRYHTMVAQLTGYTDPTGPIAYNRKLSKKRAATVMGYLEKLGFKAEQMSVAGGGPVREIEETDTEETLKEFRRVHITLFSE